MKTRFNSIHAILAILVVGIFLFSSCQKELSVEGNSNAGTSSGTCVYTYANASSNCTSPIINGDYFVNTLVTTANTIELQINVSTIGTYKVTTATTNGIIFSASGTAVNTGLQKITFTASGTPLVKGIFSYNPGYNGCSFSITVNNAIVTNLATFTYPFAPNACATDTVYGVYMVGSALVSTNYVKIPVNVTIAGAYSTNTLTVNGISFSGSGTFTTIGAQFMLLSGTGTPVLAGPFNYSPGSNGCSFLITVVPAAPPADFTFPTAPNTCNPVIIKGSFVSGSALTDANTVSLQVNVTKAGSYTIATAIVNGISFTSKGVFAGTGLQTIIFTGSGIPGISGPFNFSPGSNGCAFTINVTDPTGAAVYTVGTCSDLVINGSYITGQPLTTGNSIDVSVTVTTQGTFSLRTNLANGISFGGSGSFPSAGSFKLNIRGAGTPVAAGTNAYTFQSPNNGCAFNVVATNPAPVVSGILSCKIDGVFTSFNDRAVAGVNGTLGPNLSIDGYLSGQSVPEFQLFILQNNKSAITTGTYNEKSFIPTSQTNLGYRIEVDYKVLNPDGTTTLFNTSSNTPSFTPPYALTTNPPFQIVVTSISATRVKGTFSGKTTNTLQGSNITKVITEGIFDEPIQ